jgi:DNA polymerase elongation subunit (family B)/rubredoxin
LRILLLDIETAPNLAYVWGLWQQNIAINQIENSGYTLCWAAKWLDEPEVFFDSVHKSKPKRMLERIHKLISEADAVITYNGIKFDMPTLNKEFLLHGMHPPAPYKNIDLLQTCKRVFRFPSNKLDYVCQALGIGHKVRHEGHELWTLCMAGDKDAWGRMQAYNETDVTLLETLYTRLRPWIDRHPNMATRNEDLCCPVCSSQNYQKRGQAVTTTQKYNRYQCKECGHWFRGNKTTWKAKAGEERFISVPV